MANATPAGFGVRLAGLVFAKVFASPLQRAARTCELAGFGNAAEADRDLVEWNYGKYEGLRTAEIPAKRPDWQLFRDGRPDGELPDQVGVRADRVVSRVHAITGDVLIFSSGHFLRVLGFADWRSMARKDGGVMLPMSWSTWLLPSNSTTWCSAEATSGSLKSCPQGCRAGDNANAFLGGFRLWEKAAAEKNCAATKRR